ncbi:transcription elongation factor B polypeptide 1 [Melia azedarach]|uniref:Transcription elongation factor B polypeptide 1 n=1 Tax=Melia azedarach TaxID=155640 RepID=A0ACC1YRQ1_MELAZ|nr:transcription elongation factor B polypeptide 1 [Melia azedarach]
MKKEDTVKLISAEGFEFVIDKEAAMVSQTIRNMLTSPGSFAEREHGEVTFPEISTTILEKICQYFYWSLQYASLHWHETNLIMIKESRFTYSSSLALASKSRGKETDFHIEPELTLELMMAANYLHT